MAKNTYNLFFLWLFLTLNTQLIVFNYFFKWKLSLRRIKFKIFKIKKITFYLNHLYFFSKTWFLTYFAIMCFPLKNFNKKKYFLKKKHVIPVKIKKLLIL